MLGILQYLNIRYTLNLGYHLFQGQTFDILSDSLFGICTFIFFLIWTIRFRLPNTPFSLVYWAYVFPQTSDFDILFNRKHMQQLAYYFTQNIRLVLL